MVVELTNEYSWHSQYFTILLLVPAATQMSLGLNLTHTA